MSDSRLFFGRLGWYAAAGMVDRLVSLALLPLFIVALTPDQYGLVALALAVASILLNLGDGGLSIGFMRDYDDDQRGDRATKFSTYYFSVVVISVALCVIAWPLAGVLPEPLRFFTLLYAAANLVGFTVLVRYRIEGQPRRYFIATAALNALKLLGIGWLLTRFAPRPEMVLLGYAGANLVVMAGLVLGSLSVIRLRYDWSLVKGFFRFGFPLALTALCFCGLEILDRFLLQFFTGSAAAVGIYDMNYKIAGLMLLVITPVIQLWPEYLYKKASRVREETYQTYLLVLSYAWLLLMLATLWWACTHDEVHWFGWLITPLVALGYLFYGLYPFYSAEFQTEKRTRPILLAALLALAVNLGANCWLIPRASRWFFPEWAGHGAALATALGYGTLIGCLWFLRRRAGIARIDHGRVWRGTVPWFVALAAAVALPWTLAKKGYWFWHLIEGGPGWLNWTTLLALPLLMGGYLLWRIARSVRTNRAAENPA